MAHRKRSGRFAPTYRATPGQNRVPSQPASPQSKRPGLTPPILSYRERYCAQPYPPAPPTGLRELQQQPASVPLPRPSPPGWHGYQAAVAAPAPSATQTEAARGPGQGTVCARLKENDHVVFREIAEVCGVGPSTLNRCLLECFIDARLAGRDAISLADLAILIQANERNGR